MKKTKAKHNPVLIYDREGAFGRLLLKAIAAALPCVFVSASHPGETNNAVYVPLTRRIPIIPKCTYQTFFLIYNGDKHLIDMLPFFAEKAIEDDAHVYFVMTVRETSRGLMKRIHDISPRITIVLLGDIFAADRQWKNPVNALLIQAASGSVLLGNNGLSPVYPVNTNDVLEVMQRIVHLKGIPGHRTIYFLPPHPVTEISFVRALHKREPLIKINLAEGGQGEQLSYLPHGYATVFGPSYAYAKKLPLIQVVKPEIGQEKTVQIKPQRKRAFRPAFKFKRNITFAILTFLLVLLLAPPLSIFIGAKYLTRAAEHLLSGNLVKAKTSAKAASAFFLFAEKASPGIQMLGSVSYFSPVNKLVKIAYTGKLAAHSLSLGVDGVISLGYVLDGTSPDPKKDLAAGLQNIKDSYVQASVLKAEKEIPQKYIGYLKRVEKAGRLFVSISDVLPHLVGISEKRKYLVLFQNNMELRPGGGFIGSYGIAEVNKGRLAGFEIKDVYDAEG